MLEGPDTVVVGISRDSTWSHKAWKDSKKIRHDLLADPMLQVTKQYDLALATYEENPGLRHRMREIAPDFLLMRPPAGDQLVPPPGRLVFRPIGLYTPGSMQ